MAKKANKKATDEKASTKVVLKPAEGLLATFVHLTKPDDFGDTPKYTVTVVIPKKNKKVVKQVKDAIAAAMARGESEGTFQGKNIKKAINPLKDGDDEDTEKYPYYKDAYTLKFSTDRKPGVLDKKKRNIGDDEEEVYSGMLIWVSGAAFPYFNRGNFGVSFILGNVIKIDDGERIGGSGFNIEDEFGDDLEDDEFDEDDEDEDEDLDDDEEEDEDDEDDEDDDELDKEEAEELIADVKEIDKKAAKKFQKKLDKIDDEEDLEELVEKIEEWIEENE